MSEKNTIARPYAKALFEIALDEKQLDQYSEELAHLAVIFKDPQMVELIKDPRFSTQESLDLLFSLAPHVSPKMKNALNVIAQANRLLFLPEIAFLFEKLKAEREQVLNVTVTSAVAIENPDFINKMTAALKKRFKREKVVVEFKVDSSIIGGAIIKVGDVEINGSLKGRLNQLRSALGV